MPTSPKPRIACELSVDRVVAARAAEHDPMVETYTTRTLSRGVLAPGLSAGNVLRGDELRNAISGALANVGGRTRDVTVVVPDAAVRVMLLDFDTLPDNEQEIASIIRFRLRKSLPFDIDQAALSYDARRTSRGNAFRVVAAVAPRSVIDEYEAAFRDTGYNPGVVLPSMIATLGIVTDQRPTMVVKVDPGSITVAIIGGEDLRLLRTVENSAGTAISPAQLASEIYPSVIFFEDTFGEKVENILVGGAAPAELAPALQEQTSATVRELPAGRYIGGSGISEVAPWMLAAVAGALVA